MTEPLLVVEDGGEVGDEHDEGGGDVDGHDGTENVSLEAEPHTDAHHAILEGLVGDLCVGEAVLLHFLSPHPFNESQMGELEKVLILNRKVHPAALGVEWIPEEVVVADKINIVGPAVERLSSNSRREKFN